MEAPVRVEVVLDPGCLREWHLALARTLQTEVRAEVAVRWSDQLGPPSAEIERLFRLERAVNRLPPGPSSRAAADAFGRWLGGPNGAAEVVVDLTGRSPVDDVPTWHLTFDGSTDERAVVGALLAGRFPTVEVVSAADGSTVLAARPGAERPGVVVSAFEDILARCVDVVVLAVSGARTGPPERSSSTRVSGRLAPSAARAVIRAVARQAFHLLYRAPHWRCGWRFVDGQDVIDARALGGGWRDLPDDGQHFYADPFPAVVEGRTYLFVEDFDHRAGRASISVLPFGDDGPAGIPEPVLTHEVHLSYPCVLQEGREIWMIPETSAAGTVELYRAARFPDRWVLAEVLIEGPQVCDSTPFRHGGRWWLTGTVGNGGSLSDALHVWSADRIQGPWLPHPGNPVLIDISSARPAGRVVRRNGTLLRPFQDGSRGYGAAMGLAEITRLDDDAFEQRVVARIGTGDEWPGRWVHTVNRAGRLECIDGSAYSLRLRRGGTVGLLPPSRRHRAGAARQERVSGPRLERKT
jgi:hypothetical protein